MYINYWQPGPGGGKANKHVREFLTLLLGLSPENPLRELNLRALAGETIEWVGDLGSEDKWLQEAREVGLAYMEDVGHGFNRDRFAFSAWTAARNLVGYAELVLPTPQKPAPTGPAKVLRFPPSRTNDHQILPFEA